VQPTSARLVPSDRRLHRGFVLLDLVFALALVAVAAGMAGNAMHGLSRATAVETARLRTLSALLQTRRCAYRHESACEIAAASGATALVLRDADGADSTVSLPVDTRVIHSAATGRVRFFATGFAENATIVLGTQDGGQQTGIVVNQRGLIR